MSPLIASLHSAETCQRLGATIRVRVDQERNLNSVVDERRFIELPSINRRLRSLSALGYARSSPSEPPKASIFSAQRPESNWLLGTAFLPSETTAKKKPQQSGTGLQRLKNVITNRRKGPPMRPLRLRALTSSFRKTGWWARWGLNLGPTN